MTQGPSDLLLAKLWAMQEIEKLLNAYCDYADTGRFDDLAALLAHARLTIAGTDMTYSGAQGVRDMINQHVRLYDGQLLTKHVLTNVTIDVDDDCLSAQARSSFILCQATPDLPLQVILTGRYHDQFRNHAGRWMFHHRDEIIDLAGNLSGHVKVPAAVR